MGRPSPPPEPEPPASSNAEIVKFGTAALGALEEAAKSKDVEVAIRAKAAADLIGNAARQGQVAELKKIEPAARMVLQQRMNEARAAQAKAAQAAAEAERAGKQDEAGKLRAEAQAAGALGTALTGLYRLVAPAALVPGGPGGPVQALYGVRMQ